MKLNPKDLESLSEMAVRAARRAESIIQAAQTDTLTVEQKTTGSSLASQVVTEVDRASQEAILDVLQPTCSTFDLALLTEETEDDQSRFEKDFFWCIDPLDGTLPFIEGRPGYAVSIALVSRDAEAVIGVILDPSRQRCFKAVKDQGVELNGSAWKPPSPDADADMLTIITDRSFRKDARRPAALKGLEKAASDLGLQGIHETYFGGSVINACSVFDHQPACYFKLPHVDDRGGSLWDYAAAACLFREAGFTVHDLFGQPLDLNRRETTFMNHRGFLYASSSAIARKMLELMKGLPGSEHETPA